MQPTASPDYYVRLGLESDPFATNAMPEFFFVGAQRRFLVQRAVHALYFSGATVLLLGADGIGKTRTLDEIEKELQDLADICRIEATVLMDAVEIRGLLAAALGLPATVATGNTELAYALERMRPADGDPQPILIAIDAAQLLSIETLAECVALVAGTGGRLRWLLAGEADLAIGWQQAQAGAAEILELAPLDRNETADYVRTKLQAVGYREEQPLSDAEFDQLFAQSGGNFAAINVLTPQFLQSPTEALPAIRRIKALPMLHIGLIAGLLTIVILLMLYRGGANSSATKEAQISKVGDDRSQQVSEKKHGAEQRTVALQLPESTTAVPTSSNVTSPESAATVSTRVEESTSSVPAEKKPAPIENKNPATDTKSITEKKLLAEKKLIAQKKEATHNPEAMEKSAAIEGHETLSDKAVAIKQSDTLNADERALLEFPSSNYVLQLMGAESKTTVDKFENTVGNGLKLYSYRTQLRGKPWFIVVTGPYADKNAAQAAQAKLPEVVRKQQPWPRTLANVQADIRAHSGR